MSQLFLLKTERGWDLFILLSRFGLNFVAFISSLNSVMVHVVLVHDTLFWPWPPFTSPVDFSFPVVIVAFLCFVSSLFFPFLTTQSILLCLCGIPLVGLLKVFEPSLSIE